MIFLLSHYNYTVQLTSLFSITTFPTYSVLSIRLFFCRSSVYMQRQFRAHASAYIEAAPIKQTIGRPLVGGAIRL